MYLEYYSSVYVEKNLYQFTTVISATLKGKYWSVCHKDTSHNELNEQQKEKQANKQTYDLGEVTVQSNLGPSVPGMPWCNGHEPGN